jgi:ketosteroid isomerase-like protein
LSRVRPNRCPGASAEARRRRTSARSLTHSRGTAGAVDPEIEWRGPREFPDRADPHFGHEGVRRYIEKVNEAFEDYRMVPEEFIDAGGDQVLVFSREGVREFLALIREQWATMRLEPQDFVDAGDNVVVSVRLVGVGKQSGVETTANAAHLWTFRGAKIVRQTTFQTMDEALEAAGLRE